jgi:hypothetical protein
MILEERKSQQTFSDLPLNPFRDRNGLGSFGNNMANNAL